MSNRRNRSRSSQHSRIRSVLRSLLLDSDQSDEDKGDIGPAQQPSAPPLISPTGPLLEVSVDAALLRNAAPAPGPVVTGPIIPCRVRHRSVRLSNTSFVAATPDISPLTDHDGIPATPTDELDLALACGAALPPLGCHDLALAPDLQLFYQDVPQQRQEIIQNPPSPPEQHQQPHKEEAVNPADGALPRQPSVQWNTLTEPQELQGAQDTSLLLSKPLLPPELGAPPFQQPQQPPKRSGNQQQSRNPVIPGRNALWTDTAAGSGPGGATSNAGAAAVSTRPRSGSSRHSPPGNAPTLAIPAGIVATSVAGLHKMPARPQSPLLRTQSTSLNSIIGTSAPPGPSAAHVLVPEPAPAAAISTGSGFIALTLTRSPMATGGATGRRASVVDPDAGVRSLALRGALSPGRKAADGIGPSPSLAPLAVALAQREPQLSPTRRRAAAGAAGQPASTHYPGLVFKTCYPPPWGATAELAPGRCGSGEGVGEGDNDGRQSRAQLNLSGKLNIYTEAPGVRGTGHFVTRVTAVAMPAFQHMPAARALGVGPVGTNAATTPLPTAIHQASALCGNQGAVVGDQTPACQQVRGVCGAGRTAPPSSAKSTPFDDEMLAAIDSLERRVLNATAAIPAAGGTSTGLEVWVPRAGGAMDWHAGIGAAPPVGGGAGAGVDLGESSAISGHIATAYAPVVTALELIQREQPQQDRTLAQQHHQPAQLQAMPQAPPQQLWPPQPQSVRPQLALHHQQQQHNRHLEPPQPGQRVSEPHGAATHQSVPSGSVGQLPPDGQAVLEARPTEPSAVGVTPQAALRGVLPPPCGPAPAGPQGGDSQIKIMVGVTPVLESGGVLAALDEAEERHRRAEAEAAMTAVGVDGAVDAAVTVAGLDMAAMGMQGAAVAAPAVTGNGGGSGSGIAAGPFHLRESPLPVKQLAFTPVHATHVGQQQLPHHSFQLQHHYHKCQQQQPLQKQQPQPQQRHAGDLPAAELGLQLHTATGTSELPPRAPLRSMAPMQPQPNLHPEEPQNMRSGRPSTGDPTCSERHSSYPEPQQKQGQQHWSRQGNVQAEDQQAHEHGAQGQGQRQQGDQQAHGKDLRPPLVHAHEPVGLALSPAVREAAATATNGANATACTLDETELGNVVQAEPCTSGHGRKMMVDAAAELGADLGDQGGKAPVRFCNGAAGTTTEVATAISGSDHGSSDDEDAEAYAAALTQSAVVGSHLRQARQRQSLAPGLQAVEASQRVSGNLHASMAAVADAGTGGGYTPAGNAANGGDEAVHGQLPQVDEQPPEPPRQLEAYLPAPLCQAYYERSGHFELYAWQAECLCQLGVLMGRNLVYCAPTSGGKSMVAEVLGLRRLLITGKPFMIVLPFVALCAEKANSLGALLAPLNRVVNSAYGGQHSGKIIQPGVGAIVATIEKANMLVNAMLEEDTLGELSAVVVDELHMVGEEERGYLLELLLTKLRFATSAAAGGDGEMEAAFDWTAVGPAYQREGLQVIGMSATMPNVDVVAKWLDAALYTTAFRPVVLQEYVKVGRRILDSSGNQVRELTVERSWEDRDGDHVAHLTAETVREGHSVLIFCASKMLCEKVAEHIARMLQIAQRDPPPVTAVGRGPDGDGDGDVDGASSPRGARDAYVAELRRLSGADPALADLVARGVAYHHAGLSNEERDLVEAAYKAGAISVLTATSTLAAGVNLPARRVIFRHTYIGKQDNPIDATKYRQMSGRAGRAGIDTAGESYLICERNKPVAPLLALMQQKASSIESCLTEKRKGMKRAVLEVVASGAVSSGGDVKRFIGCTLLNAQNGFQTVAKATIAALHWLKDNSFIRVDEGTLNWSPTPFGKATLASSMPPEDALVVRADLERARMSLVLATDLHVTYLVTPIKEDLRVDWEIYFHWFEKLSRMDARVAELVGVVPAYLVKLRQGHRGARGGPGAAAGADAEKERIARRFFAAMVLNDLIQEVPLKEVAEKYGLGKEKGPLEGLQERAGRFAAMVAAFCERLGWADMEVIIAKFQSRVWYGVRPEVVALTEIPYVKGHRARLLFKAGLRTPEAVAGCELQRLIEILSAGAPRNPEHEEQQRRTERRAARMILQGAKDLVNHKVQELKEQAKALRAALDPIASQQHSAPLDASMAPPQPPQQPRQQQDALQQPQGCTRSASHPLPGAPTEATAAVVPPAAPVPIAADGRGDDDGSARELEGPGSGATTPVRPPKQQRREEGNQPGASVVTTTATDGQRLNGPNPQGASCSMAAQQQSDEQGHGELRNHSHEGLQSGRQQQLQPGHQNHVLHAQLNRHQQQGPGPPEAAIAAAAGGAVTARATATTAGSKRLGQTVELAQDHAWKRARPFAGDQSEQRIELSAAAQSNAPQPPAAQPPQSPKEPVLPAKALMQPPQPSKSNAQSNSNTLQQPSVRQPLDFEQRYHKPGRQQQEQPCYGQQPPPQQRHYQCPPQQPYDRLDQRQQKQQQQASNHHIPRPFNPYVQDSWEQQEQPPPPPPQQQPQQQPLQQQLPPGHYPQQQHHLQQLQLQDQQRQQRQHPFQQMLPAPPGQMLPYQLSPNQHDQPWPGEHLDGQQYPNGGLQQQPQQPQQQLHTAPPQPQGGAMHGWLPGQSVGLLPGLPTGEPRIRQPHPSHRPVLPQLQCTGSGPCGSAAPNSIDPTDMNRPKALPSLHASHHCDRAPQQSNTAPTVGRASGGGTGPNPSAEQRSVASSPQVQFPVLHVPGFTVVKTAAEVAVVCDQLRQVGLWGFALDFADGTVTPSSAAPGMALPSVPQVALGRGVLVNSIGLPLHYDMEEPLAPAAPPAVTSSAPASASSCRLEGIAFCAFDGCALYVPFMASPTAATGAAELGPAAMEAAAVLMNVRQLLAHEGSTKVTFDLKQQLLMARTALAGGDAAKATSLEGVTDAEASTAMVALSTWQPPGAETAAVGALDLPLDVVDPVVDARILLWMLDPDDPVNLPRGKSGKLTVTKGLEERMKQPEVCGAAAHTKAMGALNCAGAVVRQLPSRQADACRRAAMVRRIYQDKLPRLQSEGLLRPLLELEMPLVRVLAAMEVAGVALAPQVLRDQRGPLLARLRQLAHKAHLAAGMTFDLNSPKDVSEVLFQHLGLPPPPCAFTNQHQRHPSTKKDVLEELDESTRHPILRLLLDYRSLHKLLTGFVDTLYTTARGQWLQQQQQGAGRRQQQQQPTDGERPSVPQVIRLCGTWLHTGTATGRLAMDEPNLQNVPRPVEYSFQLSQESGTPGLMGEGEGGICLQPLALEPGDVVVEGCGGRTVTMRFNLRNAFVAPPGRVILTADYKQIELRLMAHFSNDTALCELLRNPNQDPFTLLAAEWKHVPVEQVTPEVRVQAKRLAYGMLYGMGTSTLAMEMGVSLHEAAELSDNFRRAIPGVDRWTKEVVEECRNCGYIVTLLGRRRYFPRINERSSKEARSQRAQSERQAVNSVCQGSAADLVKAAMITLTRRLAAAGWAGRARLVLMVHDELVLEVEAVFLAAVATLVREVLEGEVRLRVPTPVKLSTGPSWGQLAEYDPPMEPPQARQPHSLLQPPAVTLQPQEVVISMNTSKRP